MGDEEIMGFGIVIGKLEDDPDGREFISSSFVGTIPESSETLRFGRLDFCCWLPFL